MLQIGFNGVAVIISIYAIGGCNGAFDSTWGFSLERAQIRTCNNNFYLSFHAKPLNHGINPSIISWCSLNNSTVPVTNHVLHPFQMQHQPVRRVPIQIIPMQLLTPDKSQSLIKFHGRNVRFLRLQHNFICVPLNHSIDGLPHQRRCNAMIPVTGRHGQHGDVATESLGRV